jgi:hypothetical protein
MPPEQWLPVFVSLTSCIQSPYLRLDKEYLPGIMVLHFGHDFFSARAPMLPRPAVLQSRPALLHLPPWSYHQTGILPRLKSFISHSYENCRGVPSFFPIRNASIPATSARVLVLVHESRALSSLSFQSLPTIKSSNPHVLTTIRNAGGVGVVGLLTKSLLCLKGSVGRDVPVAEIL